MLIQQSVVENYQPGEVAVPLASVPVDTAPIGAHLVYEMPAGPGEPKMQQVLAASHKGIGPMPPAPGWFVFFDGAAVAPNAPPGCVKAFVWTLW